MEEISPNPLAAYLARKKIKRAHFAKQLGVTRARVTQICHGWVSHLALASTIEQATEGEVPATAWIVRPTPTQESAV